MRQKNVFRFSLVSEYIGELRQAFEDLGTKIDELELEKIAIFLTRSMGAETRDYHRPEHSLDVAKELRSIPKLAALFHDIVYVQVDSTWSTMLSELIKPFSIGNDLKLNVKRCLEGCSDKRKRIAAIVFGLDAEEELTTVKGLNEFLSCLVLIETVGHLLSERDLIRAIACIESTIPFRKTDSAGLTPADRLAARLRTSISTIGIKGFGKADIVTAIDDCRQIVEKDLASFGSEKAEVYVSNTWKVIFENYPSLRNAYFLIIEYRRALYGTYSFLSGLLPSCLFWVDQTECTAQQKRLTKRAEYNLELAKMFLRIQISAACLLEAIALETGGDVPWEYFMGQNRKSREHDPIDLAGFLSKKVEPRRKENDVVYDLLHAGRGYRSRFDRKNAPVAAFLYAKLSDEERAFLWDRSEQFIQRHISSEELLGALPKPLITTLLDGIGRMAPSRKVRVEELATRLRPDRKKAA